MKVPAGWKLTLLPNKKVGFLEHVKTGYRFRMTAACTPPAMPLRTIDQRQLDAMADYLNRKFAVSPTFGAN